MLFDKTSTYPVAINNTWDVIDSSKLQTYMMCPRMFFFNYILGWQTDFINNHLTFGTAWHEAMAFLLDNGVTQGNINGAYDEFLKSYRKELDETTDAIYHPKSPGMVRIALEEFVLRFQGKFRHLKTLYTEISGVVPVNSEGDCIHLRMDAVLETEEGKIQGWEHKTGSQLTGNWIDKWHLSTQIGTYTFATQCFFQDREVSGIVVNGAFFRKKGMEYVQEMVYKTDTQMGVWLQNVNTYLDRIKKDMLLLSETTIEQPIMKCFSLNTQACDMYRGCAYRDFCRMWGNPCKQVTYGPPVGMKEEWWDPRERDTSFTVDVEKGFEKVIKEDKDSDTSCV